MSYSSENRQPGESSKITSAEGKIVTAHRVQKLLGTIAAASMVIPLGLLRARPVQRWFNTFRLHPKKDRRKRLCVSQACMRALIPWRNRSFLRRGAPLGNIPHRRSVITTDASLTGWEAVWEGRTVNGKWEPPWSSEHIKCARTEGCSSSPITDYTLQTCTDNNGQYLCSLPHKSPRGGRDR